MKYIHTLHKNRMITCAFYMAPAITTQIDAKLKVYDFKS